MRALGVSRSEEFSPNSIEKDARILHAVGNALLQHGDVLYWSENDLDTASLEGIDVVFSMGRKASTVERLAKLEAQGVLVVNPAQGILNSERLNLSACFLKAHVPTPETLLLTELPDGVENWPFPCWLKRADACAQLKADVQYLENKVQAAVALADFKARGIQSAVVTAHLAGDLIKFYGVAGTDFFFWSYPDIHKTKFGLEDINGEARGFAFDEKAMKMVCDETAKVLSLPVYGGDCIVDPQGNFKIIDFNDWPSFSACCETAGEAIAKYIITEYER